jgi:hypothetical protein
MYASFFIYLSLVTCHLSPVICHLSIIICHFQQTLNFSLTLSSSLFLILSFSFFGLPSSVISHWSLVTCQQTLTYSLPFSFSHLLILPYSPPLRFCLLSSRFVLPSSVFGLPSSVFQLPAFHFLSQNYQFSAYFTHLLNKFSYSQALDE